ncbi:hypothetical protein GALL_519400 [mine drainage metagenome]|uniref:Uncharacterized protein n=1 Tax=mine drainage metagenome TaxID=410659 RepID=A0A1J5P4K3_9ZZZZ
MSQKLNFVVYVVKAILIRIVNVQHAGQRKRFAMPANRRGLIGCLR